MVELQRIMVLGSDLLLNDMLLQWLYQIPERLQRLAEWIESVGKPVRRPSKPVVLYDFRFVTKFGLEFKIRGDTDKRRDLFADC